MSTTLVIIVIAVLLVLWLVSIYNSLVRLRNTREQSFADIDVQLQMRHDLIPNLVATVKGYAAHEAETLQKVTDARAAAMSAKSIDDKIQAETQLGQALANLKVAVEAYPDLKANQNFLELQNELTDVENKLAAARRWFNSTTNEYNTKVQSFPANLIAGSFGFKKESMFEVSAEERATVSKAPEVKF